MTESNSEIVIEVNDLGISYITKQGKVRAAEDVSFKIRCGEFVGLSGESGCGKTTVGRTLLRLYESDGGRVYLDPEDFDHEETGVVLKGAHSAIKDCHRCHRKDNTLPRKKTRSYLFSKTGCTVCHVSPHPGHQEKCLACHNQKNWEVDIWIPGEIQ